MPKLKVQPIGLDQPSRFTNSFYVLSGGVIRIAFAEKYNGEQRFHTAVTMLPQDAMELATLLLRFGSPKHESDPSVAKDPASPLSR